MNIDGILNVYKPAGSTSFEIVRFVKGLSPQKKVGHGGTLDPGARGVLPICLGRGTKATEFLAEARKAYRAEIELGVSTDTYDAEGKVTQRSDISSITLRRIEETLASFRGPIEQIPPMYSALKYRGKRLYELARAGITVEREKRRTHIFNLEIVQWSPPLVTLEVECGRGTYIRSLAHDLGQKLGCGSHLRALERLKTGPFEVSQAVTLTHLQEAFEHGRWQDLLYPVDFLLMHCKAVILDKEQERKIQNGQPLKLPREQPEALEEKKLTAIGDTPEGIYRYRAYSEDGRFLAVLILKKEKRILQPYKLFS